MSCARGCIDDVQVGLYITICHKKDVSFHVPYLKLPDLCAVRLLQTFVQILRCDDSVDSLITHEIAQPKGCPFDLKFPARLTLSKIRAVVRKFRQA